jgi:hypothetical protein
MQAVYAMVTVVCASGHQEVDVVYDNTAPEVKYGVNTWGFPPRDVFLGV